MSLFNILKNGLKQKAVFQNLWGGFCREQLHRNYRQRREYYAELIEHAGIIYNEKKIEQEVQERLVERGYTPIKKSPGDIHTFAFIPNISWHHHLLPDLKILGPVTWFDYAAIGFRWEEFSKADRNGITRRKEMNQHAISKLIETHNKQKVDWVFVYASGLEISASTIRKITEDLGIPSVNMCLDDKTSWTGPLMGDHRAGQIDIASSFDISWTSARIACEWYMAEGGRPIYMPEGFNINAFKPANVKKDIPVSFVGNAYGFRPSIIRYLKKYGVPVHTFGKGWPGSKWVDNIVEIFNRSFINIGMGGIEYSESLTNVKGRDFEIPATGGGIYLTSFNPDLAQHFIIGDEIICYKNRDELLEMIRHYLKHLEEAKEIAYNARERCIKEHRWLHRYKKICNILGILNEKN
jgi:spore maturation protein CgeB